MTPELSDKHHAYLRRIAQHLVYDEADADDILQQAWLAALTHPPSSFSNFYGWMSHVLRMEALKSRDRSVRRRDVELLAARVESSALEHDLDREVLHGILAEAIDALGEPYRTVLKLRYFDELSPPHIARHLGRSLNTIKTQLRRGLERLRSELDERYPDRRLWSLGLIGAFDWKREDLPLQLGLGASAGSSLAGLLVSWKSVAAIAVALSLGLWLAGRDSSPTNAGELPLEPGEVLASAQDTRPATEEGQPAGSPGERQAAAEAPTQPVALDSEELVAADDALRLVIHVCNLQRQRMEGARVYSQTESGSELLGTTDAEGTLNVLLDDAHGVTSRILDERFLALWATIDGLAASRRTFIPVGDLHDGSEILVALRGGELVVRGRVLDAEGAPLADAVVAVSNDSDREPDHRENALSEPPFRTRTDGNGEFELRHLTQVDHLLHASKEGWPSALVNVGAPGRHEDEVTITLVSGVTVYGFVRDAASIPVPDARVWVEGIPSDPGQSRTEVRTGPDGSYELADLPLGRLTLHASGPGGSGNADVDAFEAERVRLDLGLRLLPDYRARLTDEEGHPFRGARVTFVAYGLRRGETIVGGWMTESLPDEHGRISLTRNVDPDQAVYGLVYAPETGQLGPVGWTRWDAPDPAERVIVCRPVPDAWGAIHGLLLDARGTPKPGVLVRLMDREKLSIVATTTKVDGSFALDRLPPANYRQYIQEPNLGHCTLTDLAVGPRDQLDLGGLRLPETGRVVVEWGHDAPETSTVHVAQALSVPGQMWPEEGVYRGRVDGARALDLLPGTYTVAAVSGNALVQVRRFVVRGGREHIVPLVPEAPPLATFDARGGVHDAVTFRVHAVPPDFGVRPGRLTPGDREAIREHTPLSFETQAARGAEGIFHLEQHLEPGHWAVLAETADGLSGGALVEVQYTSITHAELELD